MADIFTDGIQARATTLNQASATLIAQGNAVLNSLFNDQLDTLTTFERKLSALNGRRQRANRSLSQAARVVFPVTDFLSIDQNNTDATVRIDTGAATLCERNQPTLAQVESVQFASSTGTVTSISSKGWMYLVYCPDGATPTGTFLLKLIEPLEMTNLVIDIAAMLSNPTITIQASSDGVNWVTAAVQHNGYRLTGIIPATSVQYIQIIMTPSQADLTGSQTFTLGVTDFYSSSMEFQLFSQLMSASEVYIPRSNTVLFSADDVKGLTYFLSLSLDGSQVFQQVTPGQTVTIPGSSQIHADTIGISNTGVLNYALPAGAGSLVVYDDATALEIPVVYGLSPTDPNVSKLRGSYIAVNGTVLTYVSATLAAAVAEGKTFLLEYGGYPAQITAQLKVQIITTDRTVSPVFHGAILQEIY